MDGTEIYTKKAKLNIRLIALKYLKFLFKWSNRCKWLLMLLLLFLLVISVRKEKAQVMTLQGQALGKNYTIQYKVKGDANYRAEIEALLTDVSQALDISNGDSELARFNRHNCTAFHFESSYLYPILAKSKEIYNQTQGAFDPTVAPLIKLWRSNLQKGIRPADLEIQALQEYVGLDYVVVNQKRVKKLKEGVTVDLDSIISSYGIDLIVTFLQSKGIKDLCVELGDEAVAYGKNSDKQPWQIIHTITGNKLIIEPFSVHSKLNNKAISIVRRYDPWEDEQNMHIVIDPQTGYAVYGNIIAALVLANDSMTASAYATAILTKDFHEATKMFEMIDNADVFLIYQNEQGKVEFYNSKGLHIQTDEGTQEIYLEIGKAMVENSSKESEASTNN
jgi:thiamine biosynthesis lipoprotein